MGGGSHSSDTVVTNNVNKTVNQQTDNTFANNSVTHENNLYNNVINGDKSVGGALTATNTVNAGTAIYKLQNLSTGQVEALILL